MSAQWNHEIREQVHEIGEQLRAVRETVGNSTKSADTLKARLNEVALLLRHLRLISVLALISLTLLGAAAYIYFKDMQPSVAHTYAPLLIAEEAVASSARSQYRCFSAGKSFAVGQHRTCESKDPTRSPDADQPTAARGHATTKLQDIPAAAACDWKLSDFEDENNQSNLYSEIEGTKLAYVIAGHDQSGIRRNARTRDRYDSNIELAQLRAIEVAKELNGETPSLEWIPWATSYPPPPCDSAEQADSIDRRRPRLLLLTSIQAQRHQSTAEAQSND